MIAGLAAADLAKPFPFTHHFIAFDKTGPIIDYCYDTMTILPLSNRILLPEVNKPNPGIEKKLGGVVVPGDFNAEVDAYVKVRALAVGPGCVSVKKNDLLLVHTTNVNKIEFDGQAAYFVSEPQVLCVLKPDEVEKKTPPVDSATPPGKRSRKVYPVAGAAAGRS